jgi:hypothetical protein
VDEGEEIFQQKNILVPKDKKRALHIMHKQKHPIGGVFMRVT